MAFWKKSPKGLEHPAWWLSDALKSKLKSCLYCSLRWIFIFFLHEVLLLFMFNNFTIFNLLTKNGIIVQTTVLTGHLKTVLLVLSQWEEAPVQKYSMQCGHDRETPYVSSHLNLFQPKTANLLGQFYFCVSVSLSSRSSWSSKIGDITSASFGVQCTQRVQSSGEIL